MCCAVKRKEEDKNSLEENAFTNRKPVQCTKDGADEICIALAWVTSLAAELWSRQRHPNKSSPLDQVAATLSVTGGQVGLFVHVICRSHHLKIT